MDAEQAKTIAAFGGLVLGIISLGYLLYDKFLKKAELTRDVESFEVNFRKNNGYDIQISGVLSAKKGDVFIKEIELCNDKTFKHMLPSGKAIFNRMNHHTRKNFLDLDESAFEKDVKEFMKQSLLVRDHHIPEKAHSSFTLVDRLFTERLPDGYDDWSRSGWSLRVVYNDGQALNKYITFTQHKQSNAGGFSS